MCMPEGVRICSRSRSLLGSTYSYTHKFMLTPVSVQNERIHGVARRDFGTGTALPGQKRSAFIRLVARSRSHPACFCCVAVLLFQLSAKSLHGLPFAYLPPFCLPFVFGFSIIFYSAQACDAFCPPDVPAHPNHHLSNCCYSSPGQV